MPTLVLSGASGVVGKHVLATLIDRFRVYGLARRSMTQSGVSPHDHLTWVQVDIADWAALKSTMGEIKRRGGADFVIHLAAHYDFTYGDHPEYLRTNVKGTRHMLEQARWLGVRRFVFASSIAACSFPPQGEAVTEASPADAAFPYARSKRRGEELVREYSRLLPCSVVRLAAVFSDWCEYVPLYVFLSTWLSGRWNARIVAGRGESAISFIHVNDLSRFLVNLLARSHSLPAFAVYLASPDGCTSHQDLFEAATRFHFGHTCSPLLLPKAVVAPGAIVRDLACRLAGSRPFERPWTLRYIDRRLVVDASLTRTVLDWAPRPRYEILRRLLFLVERRKSEPNRWRALNEEVLRRLADRPNLRIYAAMTEKREELVATIAAAVRDRTRGATDSRDGLWFAEMLYRLLAAAVRTGDRALVLQYVGDAARRCLAEGKATTELTTMLACTESTVIEALSATPGLRPLRREIHDAVALTLEMARDTVEDNLEVVGEPPFAEAAAPAQYTSRVELERFISQLEAFDSHVPEPGQPGGRDRQGGKTA